MKFGDVSPIGQWRPRWNWFKLGVIIDITVFPHIVIGFGIVAFEAHLFTWSDGFDIDAYIGSPLGYAGAHFEFLKEEESSEVR